MWAQRRRRVHRRDTGHFSHRRDGATGRLAGVAAGAGRDHPSDRIPTHRDLANRVDVERIAAAESAAGRDRNDE